jgi:hypothetical protein
MTATIIFEQERQEVPIMWYLDPNYLDKDIVTVEKGIVQLTQLGYCYLYTLREALTRVTGNFPESAALYGNLEPCTLPYGDRSDISWFFKYITNRPVNNYVLNLAHKVFNGRGECTLKFYTTVPGSGLMQAPPQNQMRR